MQLSTAVYAATRSFPKEELFGLTNQLRRASVSIPSNIAEGKGRVSPGELIQFHGIACGSALEVQTQVELAMWLGFGQKVELEAIHDLVMEVTRILNASSVTRRSRHAARAKKA